jgi:hypothetical protein
MKDILILLAVGLGIWAISKKMGNSGGEWSQELLDAIKQQNLAAKAATHTQAEQDYIVKALSTLDKQSQEKALAAIKAGADPLAIASGSAYGFYIDPVTGQMWASG